LCVKTDVFATGNSSIVFSKSREPTKKIALTFDDGPHPRYTQKILNILEKYGIKATFFVIGVNIQNYPEPLKLIHAAGHEIGNHSFSHDNVHDLDANNAIIEMKKCEQAIYDCVVVKSTLFRPPRGAYNQDVEKAARELGYSVIMWSIDTLDWCHTPAYSISNNVCTNVCGGDIIIMHDYTSGKNTTCDALELMIPKLLAEGYEFVTISELIER
jgi:polysaccharide deacetylase family sporulation protein PdaB